jgi:hypothetical protein
MASQYDGAGVGLLDGRTVCGVAFTQRVRQAVNLLFALAITGIGVIALVNAASTPGRIFDIFVVAVGLAAIYLVIVDLRRKRT